jgi:hypothetical protein
MLAFSADTEFPTSSLLQYINERGDSRPLQGTGIAVDNEVLALCVGR